MPMSEPRLREKLLETCYEARHDKRELLQALADVMALAIVRTSADPEMADRVAQDTARCLIETVTANRHRVTKPSMN